MKKLIIAIGALTVLVGCTSQASVDPVTNPATESITNIPVDSPQQTPESSPKSQTSNQFNFPQVSCGDKASGGDVVWYPVFVDHGDLETIRRNFCADSISTVREDSQVKSVQLASFTSYDRALEFAEAVGGDVGQPTFPESAQNSSADSEVEPEVEPQSESLPPDSSPPPTVTSSVAPITLNAFHWRVNSANSVEFEGQVTNTSDQPIKFLQALAEFYTVDGKFITSASTFVDIDPLMPGQTTPFKGYESFRFEMETVKIRFKTYNGEISYTDAR